MDSFFGNPYGGRPLSSHANSAESFQLTLHWIRQCLTEHKDCQAAVCPYEWSDEREKSGWESNSSCSESDDLETSLHPPLKRARRTSISRTDISQDRLISGNQFGSLGRKYGSHMSEGLLSRPIQNIRRSKSPPYDLEDGYWKFYLRSESLKDLKREDSELLVEDIIPFLPT